MIVNPDVDRYAKTRKYPEKQTLTENQNNTKTGFLSEKIIIESPESEKIGSLESEKIIIESLESREIGSLHVRSGYLTFSLKKLTKI